jgi:hypothetical protein
LKIATSVKQEQEQAQERLPCPAVCEECGERRVMVAVADDGISAVEVCEECAQKCELQDLEVVRFDDGSARALCWACADKIREKCEVE